MNPNHPPSLHAIVAAVEAEFELTPRTLYRHSRRKEICRPRQIAWWLMREVTEASFPQIGRYFRMDHSTVMSGVERIQRGLVGDGDLWAIVERLRGALVEAKPKKQPKISHVDSLPVAR